MLFRTRSRRAIQSLLYVQQLVCLVVPAVLHYTLGGHGGIVVFSVLGPLLAALVNSSAWQTWALQLVLVAFSAVFGVADALRWEWFYLSEHELPTWFAVGNFLNWRVVAPCAIVACAGVFHSRSRTHEAEMERVVCVCVCASVSFFLAGFYNPSKVLCGR